MEVVLDIVAQKICNKSTMSELSLSVLNNGVDFHWIELIVLVARMYQLTLKAIKLVLIFTYNFVSSHLGHRPL